MIQTASENPTKSCQICIFVFSALTTIMWQWSKSYLSHVAWRRNHVNPGIQWEQIRIRPTIVSEIHTRFDTIFSGDCNCTYRSRWGDYTYYVLVCRHNNRLKQWELLIFKNDVYRTDTIQLHWNLQMSVEMKSLKKEQALPNEQIYSPTDGLGNKLNEASSQSHRPVNYEYNEGLFVAVRPEYDNEPFPFCLAGVVDVHTLTSGVVQVQSVQLYEFFDCSEPYKAMFSSMFLAKVNPRKPWTDCLSIYSILFSFASFTIAKTLPALVALHLRDLNVWLPS